MKKKIIIISAVALLTIGGFVVYKKTRKPKESNGDKYLKRLEEIYPKPLSDSQKADIKKAIDEGKITDAQLDTLIKMMEVVSNKDFENGIKKLLIIATKGGHKKPIPMTDGEKNIAKEFKALSDKIKSDEKVSAVYEKIKTAYKA